MPGGGIDEVAFDVPLGLPLPRNHVDGQGDDEDRREHDERKNADPVRHQHPLDDG